MSLYSPVVEKRACSMGPFRTITLSPLTLIQPLAGDRGGSEIFPGLAASFSLSQIWFLEPV